MDYFFIDLFVLFIGDSFEIQRWILELLFFVHFFKKTIDIEQEVRYYMFNEIGFIPKYEQIGKRNWKVKGFYN